MAAFLGKQLILDMNSRRACILEAAYHVHDVERLAVTGVAIDEDGQARGTGNLANVEADILDGQYAKVRQAHGGRNGGARQIERLEAGAPRLPGRKPITGAWQPENPAARHKLTEAMARRFIRPFRSHEICHQAPPRRYRDAAFPF